MWVKTKAYFRPDHISMVIWDTYDSDQKMENAEPIPFRFNTDEIVCYNKTSSGETTIRFKRYEDTTTVLISIEEMDRLIFNTP